MRREFVGRLTTDGRTIKAGIVSDFDYSFDQANPCSRITYIPQPNFRWMDLQTDHDLSYIDLKLFYETKDGDLVPIELRPGETLQVKLVFEKL
jgi:hypothetical protein